jgi:hypothetical protein
VRLAALLILVAAPVMLASSAAQARGERARARRSAAVLEDSQTRAGLVWQAAAVYHPVEVPASGVPRELTALPRRAPGASAPRLPLAQRAEPVRVGPRRAAMLRIEPLQIARVRVLGAGQPSFHRVNGEEGAAWASTLERPMATSPGTWLLEQPPGGPGYWLVTAPTDTQVLLEVTVPRTGDLIWEHTVAGVIGWIADGGPPPSLPEVPGARAVARELLADQEIAAELLASAPADAALRRAVLAWREAAALQHIDALRRPIRASFALELRDRVLPGATPVRVSGWHRVRGPQSATWTLTGPGVLWLEARSVGAGVEGTMTVSSAGRRLASATVMRPAAETGGAESPWLSEAGVDYELSGGTDDSGEEDMSEGAGDTPAPPGRLARRLRLTGGSSGEDVDLGAVAADGAGPDERIAPRLARATGAAVGPRSALRVALAPGRHSYTIAVTGADTVMLTRVGRRNQRIVSALRGEAVGGLLRRGQRALAASDSPQAPLVRALLASLAGEPVQIPVGEEANPKLALTRALLAAGVDGLDAPTRVSRARALAREVAKIEAEGLTWRARRIGIELLEGTGESNLARELAGKRVAQAPVEVLQRLARQVAGPALAVRSPAVAVLELARRQAPLDPELRAVYRDEWRVGTRWAALRADDGASGPWTWIEPWSTTEERAAGTRALWRWRSGQAELLRAPAAPATPERAALLRMYVQMPARTGADPLRDAALSLAIGERRWHTLALTSVETWRVALPPGEHSVTAQAPAGAALWSSLPPAKMRPPEGHLLRMWPATAGGQLRFLLPRGAEPAFVRIELRALGGDEDGSARAARVWVARDDGATQAVDLWLPPRDPAIVPVEADAGLGPRASVVLMVGPNTRSVTVTLAEDAPRLAVSASIRATRGAELGDVGSRPAAPAYKPRRSDEPPLEQLARLSKELHARPEDRALRLARAELLVDLDQPGYAFVDWRELTRGRLAAGLLPRATALAERLDALDAPTTLDLTGEAPAVVEPALAVAVGDDRQRLAAVASAVAAARSGGPAAGLAALDRLGLDDARGWRAITGPAVAELPGDAAPGPTARPTKPPAQPVEDEEEEDDDEAADANVPKDRSRKPGSKTRSKVAVATMAPDSSVTGRRPAGPLLAAAVLRATWLDAAGHPEAAARVWTRLSARTGLWQAGLRGVQSFLAVLDAEPLPGAPTPKPAAEGAGLAFGLAQSLRKTVRTPALHRLATVAATRSRWSRVAGSERDNGTEGLKVPRTPTMPTPNAAVRQALIAAPWDPSEATLVRAGYATVLEQRRAKAGPLTVDLWCQSLRPDLGDGAPPQLRVVVNGAALIDGPVALDEVEGVTIAAAPAGRQRVEVAVAERSRGQVCSVRLRDEDGPLGSVRPTRWRVARPGQPVEVVVLGPTALALEARGMMVGRGAGPAPRLQVAVAQGQGPFASLGTMTVSGAGDPRATPEASRAISPGLPSGDVIALPDLGPQRVLLRPEGGPMLLRLQQRLDGEPTPVPRAKARVLDLGNLVDDIAPIPEGRTELPAVATSPAAQRFGTTHAELRGGLDDLEDSDDLRPRRQLQLRLGWARELLARRVWLQAGPELRAREATSTGFGGAAALQVVLPRAGLRARLGFGAMTQRLAGGQAWSADAHLRVDRPTWIAPRWQLLPGVDLRYRHQSLADAEVAAQAQPLHPRIYTAYASAHPLALRPSLELRWQPLQDARLFVGADVVPNSDFRSLDQVNLRGGMVGVMSLLRRVAPEFGVAYEGSIRLRDGDRARTYLQNRVLASLGLGVWAGEAARVVLGVSDTLYASAPFPLRNVFEVWLRVDLALGRGLRDYGPLDLAFRPIREHRLWVDREVTP